MSKFKNFMYSYELGRGNRHKWRMCEGSHGEPNNASPQETLGNCPQCGNKMRLSHIRDVVRMPVHYIPLEPQP